ncbi:WD repeat-containing protein on Y chromosome-like [Salvelinus namaycush]|uniref:WD repeat-containing protein on Y chromosome n=1 Tax=Salvelinus namaycush TaxID=8040 RepID=A0A8U1F0K0_SALNM|nr:WD repeat-containing protein on Y chromosome-like [Salvelinus namaycush]
MLLEYREKDSLQKQNRPLYFPKPLKIVPVAHCEPIVRLQFYPFQTPQAEKNGGQGRAVPKTRAQLGRYLSVSRDGILNYWSERFKLTRTVNLDQLKRAPPSTSIQQIWVTDMICLSNLNLLAIASTGRDVGVYACVEPAASACEEFYDISASKCDIVFSLTGLEGYAVVMDYWSDGTKAVFSIGDIEGYVSVFISSDVLQYGLFNSGAFKSGGNCRIPVPALLKNTSKYFLCFKVALHNNWCHQIRFLPELNAVATCCASDQTSMVLTTVPHSQKAKIHNSFFQLRKGILCFDYSPEFNILVTGGFDRIVRIWNPYVNNCATSQMKGHSTAITHIVVNSSDNKIISISKDKNVRVWDLQDCACLQNIHSRNVTMSRFPISSVHYNRDTNTLVLATFLIGVLHGVVDDVDTVHKLQTSHEQPLCTALYNTNFKQVVSGCHNGVVSVWEILTGEKVMQFQTSPEKAVEVTAMTFDGPKRRLITGSKDGSLRLWNFNNGALLATLPILNDNEVTGVIYINQRIYVSGWSKRVMWYLDVKEDMEMEYRIWNQYHAEDIYSMHAHGNKMLVTASYSGDIIVWNIDSGRAFCRFNACESSRPLLPNRVIDRSAFDRFEASESKGSFDESEWTDSSEYRGEATVSHSSQGVSVGPGAPPPHPPSPQEDKDSSCSSPPEMIQEESGAEKENERTHQKKSPKQRHKSGKPQPISAKELEKPRLAVEKALFLGTRERSPDTAILLTSAADGYVYAWSIHHLGGLLGKFRAVHSEGTAITTMSTDLQDQMLLTGDSTGYIMVVDGWSVSLTPPPLLSSWRGHLKGIVSLEYVERFRLIVTASLDCNVRLWTIAGSYIGTFGQAQWCVGDHHAFPWELPVDLRRVGSCQTLKVLNQGTQPHWNCAKRILETLTQQKLRHTAMASTASDLQELVPADPRIAQYSNDQIEETWQHWQEKGKQTSAILGLAYKQKVRHRPSCPLDLQVSFSSREQLRVYKSMPCTSLLPIIQPPVPELLKEQQQKTQDGADMLGKQKRNNKRGAHVRFSSAKGARRKSIAPKQQIRGGSSIA